MNAAPPAPLIPDDAPFSAAQRAWLNGFLAGLLGTESPPTAQEEDFPWHDPVLQMEERLALAEGRPLARRLMAAMAQLDCGQCGYLCQSYAEALAEGRETATGLCVPGDKPTRRKLTEILAATPAPLSAAQLAVPEPTPTSPVRVVSAARLTGATSAKDVRHIVLDLGETGLRYEPGDSISIAARQDAALVEATLAAMGATGEEPIGGAILREALSARLDIARPSDGAIDLLANCTTNPNEEAALRALSKGEAGAEPGKMPICSICS